MLSAVFRNHIFTSITPERTHLWTHPPHFLSNPSFHPSPSFIRSALPHPAVSLVTIEQTGLQTVTSKLMKLSSVTKYILVNHFPYAGTICPSQSAVCLTFVTKQY